jgi:hypothetical protein
MRENIRATLAPAELKRLMQRSAAMKRVVGMAVTSLPSDSWCGGLEGVALADHNKPNLVETGHRGYAPDYNYPLDTTQPGWADNIQSGGYVGYPSDYSNAPDREGRMHNIQGGGNVGYPPDSSNAPNSTGWRHM